MEPAFTEVTRQFAANKVIDPDPRQRAECDFERTGPVSPAMKRVGDDPAFELRANFVQVAHVARQQIGLRQNNQVLVAVQFPDRLVVARARRVEIRNAAKVAETGFNPAQIVAAPADIGTGVDGHSQNWKLVAPDLIGKIDGLLRTVGAEVGKYGLGCEPARGW